MNKETHYRPALFGKDGLGLLRVRGIRLTPDSPDPWLAYPGLLIVHKRRKNSVVRWCIHKQWNAALAFTWDAEKLATGPQPLVLARLLDNEELVGVGPVSEAHCQMLGQLAQRTGAARHKYSIPAGLSTEEHFRTLTQMFVRDMFGQDPETTFYVS